MRRTASTSTYIATRTAARRWPAPPGSPAGRGRTCGAGGLTRATATWMAARAMPSPATSVSMCPASDSRASELVTKAGTTSTTVTDAQHGQRRHHGPCSGRRVAGRRPVRMSVAVGVRPCSRHLSSQRGRGGRHGRDRSHRRTVAEFVKRLEGSATSGARRPVSGLGRAALVNHVVYEDVWTVPLMEGATIAEVGDRFEGDLLGDDPVARRGRRRRCHHRRRQRPGGRAHRAPLVRRHPGRGVRLPARRRPPDPRLGPGRRHRRRPPVDPELVGTLAAWFADEDALPSAGVGPAGGTGR